MVDQWPSRLQPHQQNHQPVIHDEREGIAALAPQFDTAVPNSRRSVPPIGSNSPHPYQSSSVSSKLQQHSPLFFNPQPSSFSPSLPSPIIFGSSLTTSSSDLINPLQQNLFSSSPNHQDLLLNLNSNSDSLPRSLPSNQNPSLPLIPPPHTVQVAKTIDFDNFDFASIDLGPPVFETKTSLSLPVSSAITSPPITSSSSSTTNQTNPSLQILSPIAQSSQIQNNITSPSSISRNQSRDFPHETRCVMIRNLPPGVDDEKIRALMLVHGPLRDLSPQQRAKGGRGSILATYYDLRHSRNAVHSLDGSLHFGRKLDVRFHNPTDPNFTSSSPQLSSSKSSNRIVSPLINQGTLVVFNLDTSISGDEIRKLFNSVGDVKEIRTTPNKKHHRFVEFFDVRDAERAMRILNKTEIGGKRIKIEISRPGGRSNLLSRSNNTTVSKFKGNTSTNDNNQSQKLYDRNGNKTSTLSNINVDHTSGDNQMHNTSSPTDEVQLSSNAVFPLMSPFGYNDMEPHLSSAMTHINIPRQDLENNDFGNTRKTFSNPIDTKAIQGLSESGSTNKTLFYDSNSSVWNGNGSISQKPVQVQQSSSNGPESYIQALYKTQSPNDGQTQSTINQNEQNKSRSAFIPSIPDSMTVDRNPRKTQSMDSFGRDPQPSPRIKRGVDENGPNAIIRGTNIRSPITNDRSIGHGSTLSRHSSHGGGYTSNNFNQNSSQQQSNTRFLLDIEKVRSGEETRTALMIRNIPNKYNQKMLLSALEEHHKGHFDFVYLPIDFKNKCNVGYAFINFTKVKFIESFYNAFHGKKWGKFNSEKICEITFARIQGRQQLLAHFQNSSLLFEDPKCRPVIFDEFGRQEDFPVGSNVRTRRGPSSRDNGHKGDSSHPYSPTKGRGKH